MTCVVGGLDGGSGVDANLGTACGSGVDANLGTACGLGLLGVSGVSTGFSGGDPSSCGWRELGRLDKTTAGGDDDCFGRCVGSEIIGFTFRRNFLFRSVILRLPSRTTLYWRCGNTSTTTPIFPYFFGLLPVWFWTETTSPTSSSDSHFASLVSTLGNVLRTSRALCICVHSFRTDLCLFGR